MTVLSLHNYALLLRDHDMTMSKLIIEYYEFFVELIGALQCIVTY